MKRPVRLTKRFKNCVGQAAAAALLGLVGANTCFAQVEAINPNPLEPAGVGSGSALETYRSGSGNGGNGLRSSGPGDNPADLMLRELNAPGYNLGRGTRRIRGASVEAARRAYRLSLERQQLLDGAVYFADRGAYEDAIYRPRRGSYRYDTKTRRTSDYRRAY